VANLGKISGIAKITQVATFERKQPRRQADEQKKKVISLTPETNKKKGIILKTSLYTTINRILSYLYL